MKKLLLLLVASVTLLFSCSKDDYIGNQGAFIGTTWEASHEYTEGDVKCKNIITFKFAKDSKFSSEAIFIENGKEIGKFTEDGTYSVSGDKLTMTVKGESIVITIGDKKLTYIADDDDGKVTYTFTKK